MRSRSALRTARDKFADLLTREDALEREWQQLFAEHPFILSESLPLRIRPSQIVPLGRPGRSEPDFVIYPDIESATLSSYGVIELKRPSTRILSAPRREIIKLSSDAETAHAQAKVYAAEMERKLYTAPERMLAVGCRAHIFLIVGDSSEIRSKVVTDIQRQQFESLLPAGVKLLPYDTLYRLFERRVPPRVHVVIPASYMFLARDRERVTFLEEQVQLSCAHADSEFGEHLTRQLNGIGVKVGKYTRLGRYEPATVVLVLSRAAEPAFSDVSSWEFLEAVGGDTLLPVALDTTWQTLPIREAVAQYNVFDFSTWREPPEFRRAFRRLVAALPVTAA